MIKLVLYIDSRNGLTVIALDVLERDGFMISIVLILASGK